jgi:hypothetical protein
MYGERGGKSWLHLRLAAAWGTRGSGRCQPGIVVGSCQYDWLLAAWPPNRRIAQGRSSSFGLVYDQIMENKLEALLRESRNRKNSSSEQEAQRRSFAYGNTHFENERITRETVDRAAEALHQDAKNRHPAR